MATELPLIVIVGPTASGKTSLALQLAKDFGGEVVSADSRTIYRGMAIGTAKPTVEEMDDISHHLIDVVDPNEEFTLWNFQQLAKQKIAEIRNRGNLPFLVGGSGLYIDSIIFDYEIAPQSVDYDVRKELEEKTIDDLIMMIKKQHLELPENYKNKRYLIRALEQGQVNRKRLGAPIENTIIVGITTDRETLETRIRLRTEKMLAAGLVDEVRSLVATYGDQQVFHSNSYGEVQKFLHGEIASQEQLIDRIITVDRQLAKKQLTWFRRNNYITWLPLDQSYDYIASMLRRS